MKTQSALFSGLITTTVAVFAQGCADTTEDLEPSTEEGAESSVDGSEPSIGSVASALDSNGRYCGGYCIMGGGFLNDGSGATCYGGNFWFYTYLPNVTQDCRARIVDFCHNRNWHFGDAYWFAGRPYTGYVCARRS